MAITGYGWSWLGTEATRGHTVASQTKKDNSKERFPGVVMQRNKAGRPYTTASVHSLSITSYGTVQHRRSKTQKDDDDDDDDITGQHGQSPVQHTYRLLQQPVPLMTVNFLCPDL